MSKKKSVSRRPVVEQVVRPEMTVYERVAWICLHLLIFVVPIAISNPSIFGTQQMPLTYDQFDIVKVFFQRAFLLVGLGSWLIGLLLKGGRVRVSKVMWLVLIFLGWTTLTTILSVHPATAMFGKYRRFEGLLSFFTYAGVAFLAIQLADRPARIRSLARTLVISGAVVAFYGFLQYVGLDPIKWSSLPFEANRAFSFFGNPDLLGGYLIFPLSISLTLAFSEKDRRWRLAYWLMFVFIGFTLLVSFVRGAWIGGFCAILIIVFALVRSRTKLTSMDWSFAGAGVLAAIAGIVHSLSASSDVMNFWARLISIFQFGEGSSRTRFEIWQAAIAAIRQRPIFGWGADTFRLLFPRFKPAAYVKDAGFLSVADNVHDYPLQIASALGIPGFLMLYGIFVWTLVKSAKDVFVKDRSLDRLLMVGFWAAVVGYLVHLMFGLSVTGSTVFLWLSLGILLAPSARTIEYSTRSWSLVAAALVAVVVVFGSYGNVRFIAADAAYMTARAGSTGAGQIQAAEKAVRLNPYNTDYRAQLGLAWKDQFSAEANAAIQAQSTDPTAAAQQLTTAKQDFDNAVAALEDTVAFSPMEYDNYVFLANIYNQAAYYFDPAYTAQAIEWSQKGIKVEKYGPAIRIQLAIAYLNTGKYDQAIAQAKYGSDLDPAYNEIRLVLGDAYRYAGRLDEARATYKAALTLEPSNQSAQSGLAAVEASISAETTGK